VRCDVGAYGAGVSEVKALQANPTVALTIDTGPPAWPKWEAGVRALYDQMARIDITPTWVKIHDFDSRIPQAVEDLARAKFGGQ
jgi:hypothetical protein